MAIDRVGQWKLSQKDIYVLECLAGFGMLKFEPTPARFASLKRRGLVYRHNGIPRLTTLGLIIAHGTNHLRKVVNCATEGRPDAL